MTTDLNGLYIKDQSQGIFVTPKYPIFWQLVINRFFA